MTFVSNLGIAFDQVAQQHRESIALLYPDTGRHITYGELNLLVDRVANNLRIKGLRQGKVAAMLHNKSPEAFAAMLACLRLGVIYTNLDPDSPWERLQKILDTCQPAVIINAFQVMPFGANLAAHGIQNILHLHDLPDITESESLLDGGPVDGGSPAYVMFTSGSTGTPKGATMSHANLLWFIAWAQDRFAITPDDVLTNVNPIFFDNSVFDFYTAIFSGATLVPFTSNQVRNTRLLVRLINDARCTIWFSVPTLLVYLLTTRALSSGDFPAIRKIIFGGEGFPKVKLKQLYDLFSSHAELENVYGPTECTCICSAHTIGPEDLKNMQQLTTLGSLAQNFEGEILPLDEANPDFGELFLRGPQVGLGYFNDPQHTAQSFIQNPRHAHYLDIGYRTGDLVQRDAVGRLHFKGRIDFQIKHMGYRIELEEIEAALASISGVAECAVVYQKLDDSLGQILAFVALHQPESIESLLHKAATLLPAYMLPRHIRLLESLPKNANGKIDRPALQQLVNKETTL